jgi:hypothetical protein
MVTTHRSVWLTCRDNSAHGALSAIEKKNICTERQMGDIEPIAAVLAMRGAMFAADAGRRVQCAIRTACLANGAGIAAGPCGARCIREFMVAAVNRLRCAAASCLLRLRWTGSLGLGICHIPR